ncbi:hypothetical protein ACHAWF_001199, partial [Thalassiosira exigua]
MEAIVKFLNNDETYKPLRATVVGCGGTGKSYIINTLISLIRRYTGLNDTVKVAAPSGGAAYNVGGCTLHRCLNLSVDAEKLCSDLTPEKQDELTGQLRNLLMLIIDERSMISSMLLAGAERNVRHCAFGKQNMTEQWAGIPVVLIFGDDYQLMPVSAEGAITGYARRLNLWNDKPTKKKPKQQLQIDRGTDLFINGLTEEVFHLTENYRSIKDPIYADILARLRKGDSTKEDGERLIRQRWDKQKKRDSKWAKETENNPKTVFLFTRNDERKAKNREKLVDLSEETCLPVARMSCMWSSNRQSGGTVYRSHFNSTNMVLQTDLCIGSTVTLSGINIVPEAGLYNGARGIVIDFLFDEKTGPNNKDGDHLPKCVVVDFPGLKLGDAKPWDRNNPTTLGRNTTLLYTDLNVYSQHVPITMYEVDCFKRCCHARYCPLVTAWATTVHKFQGFEAGFDKSDTVAHIIADIGPLTWERLNPGTAYVVSSRAKTIGDHSESNPCPYNSNLFFSGAIGPHRFTECNIKKDGNPCILVEKRDAW